MYSVKNTSNIFFSLSLEERKTRLAKASVCLFIFRIKYEAGVCYLRQNAFDTVGVVFCPPQYLFGEGEGSDFRGSVEDLQALGSPRGSPRPTAGAGFLGGAVLGVS